MFNGFSMVWLGFYLIMVLMLYIYVPIDIYLDQYRIIHKYKDDEKPDMSVNFVYIGSIVFVYILGEFCIWMYSFGY